jgi:MFS family permease
LGTGVFAVLQMVMSAEAFRAYGWRIAFLFSIVLVVFGIVVRLKASETPHFEKIKADGERSTSPLRDLFRPPYLRPTLLGMLSRWGEGAAFNTWGVFAISYATATLHLGKVDVLLVVTLAALLMAALLPVSGLLADRYGPKRIYAIGIAAYGIAVFPVFALFNMGSMVAFAIGIVIVFGVIHALFYGAQGTLYASLFPTRIRYTGLSTVYQLSGVYASGITPMILTALIAVGNKTPWLACAYLVGTAVISVIATLLLKPRDLADL